MTLRGRRAGYRAGLYRTDLRPAGRVHSVLGRVLCSGEDEVRKTADGERRGLLQELILPRRERAARLLERRDAAEPHLRDGR